MRALLNDQVFWRQRTLQRFPIVCGFAHRLVHRVEEFFEPRRRRGRRLQRGGLDQSFQPGIERRLHFGDVGKQTAP